MNRIKHNGYKINSMSDYSVYLFFKPLLFILYILAILCILFCPLSCSADQNYSNCNQDPDSYCQNDVIDSCEYDDTLCCQSCMPVQPHIFTLAPEYYYLDRKRAGGTKQTGNLGGIRISYDFIKRYNFYFGAQAFYGMGKLDGKSGEADNKIRSKWTDEQIEGYVGYTFQTKNFPYFSFTPFGGYGYFRETNKFISPSPLHIKFATQFGYFAYGFLSKIMVSQCISVGFNARFRTPWEPRCKVSGDPEFEDIKLIVGSELQYRLELPIVYKRKFFCDLIEFGLMPFYEIRNYGGRENFPFDFFKTKIKIFGIDLQLIYRF